MQFDIVCHCHLRWDFVWQRPQHLMTRLARFHRIFFLEDAAPLPAGENKPRLEVKEPQENIVVVKPLLIPRTDNTEQDLEVDRQNAAHLVPMLKAEAERRGFNSIIHWFYTPMAYWLAEEFPSQAIVYDCMDELSMFKNPPAGILEYEKELLSCADLVFTGGRSLFVSKSEHHPNVHMFPSGVEVEHFDKACSNETPIPSDIESVGHPRFTYTGVIDERLNLDLVGEVARRRPEWQFVMIGPVVKIEPEALPQSPNIHYLGQKPYADLPGYLKGTDVAIMPFALNDATRYISPTKTLEYMAARRPVVSTPIADVVAYYDQVVYVAANPDDWEQACQEALHADSDRLDKGVRAAQAQTWDSIAERMNTMLDECVGKKVDCAGTTPAPVDAHQ